MQDWELAAWKYLSEANTDLHVCTCCTVGVNWHMLPLNLRVVGAADADPHPSGSRRDTLSYRVHNHLLGHGME
jgi:hypothetical protein